ncbi:hypothetical protein IMW75_17295 [Pseudomonas gregormendelii]|uniref:DUF4145 domain-containing protein n=1 Tax=Pseudomonas gregormendelii TaxID=1628277 RepID=A0ABS3AIN0_9PSED|nr:hypothetical protein [Pseudomonas gregormendelii]MBN3967024.1 hypothetical protein [Pseudomonas gregormendelii]
MDIKGFCVEHAIDLSRCGVTLVGGSFNLIELDISPAELLILAEEDFQRGGLSALINSISNTKRAIVCQMDRLLKSFGCESFKLDVPEKVARLRGLGLLAPELLRKIVKLRNTLEHEFKAPTLEQVEDALDIARLFVMSTSAMFTPFEDTLEFSLRKASVPHPIKYLTAGLNREAGSVFYTVYVYGGDGYNSLSQCTIPSGHVLFDQLVKLSASLMMKYNVDQACKDFDAVYAAL